MYKMSGNIDQNGQSNMNEQPRLFEDEQSSLGSAKIEFVKKDHNILKKTSAGYFSGIQELSISQEWKSDLPISTIWALEELNQRMSQPMIRAPKKHYKLVDLFCGTGGFSLGVRRALSSVGITSEVAFACDISQPASEVYQYNTRPKVFRRDNVQNLIETYTKETVEDFILPSVRETELVSELKNLTGEIDIFLAGPPCEGHSNLNNKTRRSDPRNELYVLSVLIGITLRSKIILIENVPTVTSAKQNVVERSKKLLQKHGYHTKYCEQVLAGNEHLVCQTRRRHFLIAVKNNYSDVPLSKTGLVFPSLTVDETINDESQYNFNHEVLDCPAELSNENIDRVNFLHTNDVFDLPDKHRPDCHRLKAHSYQSVYGRMYHGLPAPTLSTGFLSPGRGRYTHPFKRRTLTLREGARIQGFPLSFNWCPSNSTIGKTLIARLIGDAVPPNLGQTACLMALSKYHDQ